MKKTTLGVLVVLAIMLATAGAAYARYTHTYDLTVPRLGQKDVTSTALAKVNHSRGVDNNSWIGGGKTQFTAMFRGSSPTLADQVGPWIDISSGARVLPPYYSGQNLPGSGYRLGHKSHTYTYVTVQAVGSWSPDEY